MAVEIPVSTKLIDGGKGFDDAAKAARRAEKEALDSTKRQIAEHKKVAQLTSKLDKDLAAENQARIQQYKDLAQAAAVAGGVIIGYSAQAVSDAREARAAEAQLAAAIESTGGAAGQSLEMLTAHASALQDISNFSDEAIMDGQGLLLTFTNIKEVFPDATQTMLDMSTAMDQDLKSSAIQLGKALNDPIKGLSALTRIGVTFTQQQKDQILAMMEAGDVAGAQRVILEELNREFGGSAAAAREAAGAQKDLEVSTGELSEAWGNLLLQIGDAGVTGALVNFLNTLSSGADAWTQTIARAQELKAGLGDLDLGFNFTKENFTLLANGLAELNPFVILKNSVMEFYDSLKAGEGFFKAWRDGIEAMAAGVGDTIAGLMGTFTNAQENLSNPVPVPAAPITPAAPRPPAASSPIRPGAPRVPAGPPRRTTITGSPFAGFATGVQDFIVPPGFPNDSFAVGLTSGERVNVSPASQAGSNITINVNGIGGRELAAIIERRVTEAVNEYHESVIVPWSG